MKTKEEQELQTEGVREKQNHHTQPTQVPVRTRGEQSTPGPWTVAEYGIHEVAAKYLCVKKGGKTICRVDPQGNSLAVNSTDEANAYLIAASPDLLEALKELVERCDGKEGVRADSSNIQTMRAHAAIVRAEGSVDSEARA